MKLQNEDIYQYFEQLPKEDFATKFYDLARTQEFSAVASNAGDQEDEEFLRTSLRNMGLPETWFSSKELLTKVVYYITTRIVKKTT